MIKRLVQVFGWVLVGCAGSIGLLLVVIGVAGIMVPVGLPAGSVSTGSWDNYVAARGTWVMENDRSASPVQTTQIFCHRMTMDCRVAQAEVGSGGMLYVEAHNYSVDRWDGDIITFRDTTAVCVDYAYTVSRVNQRVIGIRTTKKVTDLCSSVSKEPINLTLADGYKVEQQLRDEALAQVYPFMWMGLALLWAFVVFRVWRAWRSRSLHGTSGGSAGLVHVGAP